MTLFRKFKRHYHITKEAYIEAAQSGSLGISISHTQGGPVKYEEKSLDRDKTARFAAVVYRFLDDKSDIHYQKVLDVIATDFPEITTPEEMESINVGIKKIENGVMGLSYNERRFTARDIFQVVAKAGYFERHEEAVQLFAAIDEVPLASRLFWYQFKSYAFDSFRILSVVFDLIQAVEHHKMYGAVVAQEASKIKTCIYCLSEAGRSSSEEHPFPEALAGDEIYLPKGYVCDACNNGILSRLDEALINFDPIAFLRVQFTPYTKKGKFPKANFQNMTIEKTDPNHIKITAKDKTAKPENERTLADGSVAFNLNWTGKKCDWKLLARAVYKISLGFVAYDRGHEVALDKKYDFARSFILNGNSFPNNMLVTTKTKPHSHLRSYSDLAFGGTPYFIDIFGMAFFINLEPLPALEKGEVVNEILNAVSDLYEFELISLK